MSLHHNNDPVCPLCEFKLESAHSGIAAWFRSKKAQDPSLHVAWAGRGQADQDQFKAEGKSELSWPHSPHNRLVPIDGGKLFQPELFPEPASNARLESAALDLFQITADAPKGKWDTLYFAKLDAQNKADGLAIRWGGEWKSIGDGCHFQIVIPG